MRYILIRVYVRWENGDVAFLLCKDKYSINSVTYETYAEAGFMSGPLSNIQSWQKCVMAVIRMFLTSKLKYKKTFSTSPFY